MARIEKLHPIEHKTISLEKKQVERPKKEIPEYAHTDLNKLPHYAILPARSPMLAGQKALEQFKAQFGEIKSPTYLAQIIKHREKEGASSEEIEELTNLKYKYHKGITALRNEMDSYGVTENSTYCILLRSYLKDHEANLNCGECSSLLKDILNRKGIDAQNIYFYTTNADGQRVNKAEHVFTVINLAPDAFISDPSTWGEDAIVCDAWADICMKTPDALNFYRNFFLLEDKHNMYFEHADAFCD
ncbi:MAG: hypothetical protein IJ877_02980 [Candidatus Gastranaerophilales bacterium]|nr:hypothetical protein [Candidatus Gastranaerophilales bacterium]